MKERGLNNQKYRDKVLEALLKAKSKSNLEQKSSVQAFPIKDEGRMRRKSQQLIKDELIQLQKRHGLRVTKNQKLENLQSSKATYKSLKQLTYEKIRRKDVQTHQKALQRQSEALTPEQQEQLGYVTFKMIRQKEKHYFLDLKDKVNSGPVITVPNKGRMSLPVPPSLSFKSS